jgi:N-acetylmuramoyl-L-alanine amidase
VKGSTFVTRFQPSPNFEDRWNGLEPRLVVLHYTGMASGQAAVDWLCNPISKVSCHYLVDIDGSIVQMVDEDHRAWHAGVSSWFGETDTNSTSIGIEIQNEGHPAGCPPFPLLQMQAVAQLTLDIMARHAMAPHQAVAHSDVAPGRKVDPGEAFPWDWLAERGIGQHIVATGGVQSVAFVHVKKRLQQLGYGVPALDGDEHASKVVLQAFQRRYRRGLVTGTIDLETSEILERLGAISS